MAVSHLHFDDATKHGRSLRDALRSLENGLEGVNDTLATMALMKDGDGTQAAHWTYATSKFGFNSDANTLDAWNELNSLGSKLNVNSSVTDVNAALLQAFNKFR